jgi:hypothetical protein
MSRSTCPLVPLAAAVAIAVPAAASAQAVYEGCVDSRGVSVASVPTGQIGDVAMAAVDPWTGTPVIFYNPLALSWLAPATRRFLYAHECAHHALGHTITGYTAPVYQEQEADCWAARRLADGGSFTDADRGPIAQDLARLAPGDWAHLPGTRRAANLEACLQPDATVAGILSGSEEAPSPPAATAEAVAAPAGEPPGGTATIAPRPAPPSPETPAENEASAAEAPAPPPALPSPVDVMSAWMAALAGQAVPGAEVRWVVQRVYCVATSVGTSCRVDTVPGP